MNKKIDSDNRLLKGERNKELLFFSLLFLMTVIAWIIVEVYHIEKNKNFAVEYQKGMAIQIEELPDLDVINKLEKKK